MDGRDLDDLLDHLQRISALGRPEVAKLVAETLAFLDESLEEFVARRHAELRSRGLRNEDIFARIGAEVEARRFTAPRLTERQIRRLVYG